MQQTNDWIEGRAALVKARIADVGDELRYDLMEVVYHWASGMVRHFLGRADTLSLLFH